MEPNIQFMLGEMNAKLDTLVQRTGEDRKAHTALAARVTSLESFKWKLLGAASALGGVGGMLAKFFT